MEDEELQEVCEKMMAILCLDSRNTRDSHLSMIRASGKTFLPPPMFILSTFRKRPFSVGIDGMTID